LLFFELFFVQKLFFCFLDIISSLEMARIEELFEHQLGQKRRESLIVVDNFYNDPIQMRKNVLASTFFVTGNFPGRRTLSFATDELKQDIQQYLRDPIVDFRTDKHPSNYNGCFQITTAQNRSWVHVDGETSWAGVLFLTPFAPESSGTNFYRFHDGTKNKADQDMMQNRAQTDEASQDLTKWVKVDTIGNVFNRLVLFDSNRFHMSADYFGSTLDNGRLFQVFFFNTSSPHILVAPVLKAPVSMLNDRSCIETPVGATPVIATPVDSAPVIATPVDSAPVSAVPVSAAPIGAAPVMETPFVPILLNSIKKCSNCKGAFYHNGDICGCCQYDMDFAA
jgi:hypothetical protein